MVQTDVTITNSSNSKSFLFRGCSNWETNKSQPAQSVPFVNQTPENNILFRFFGQSEAFTWTFSLFDDGTDVSNGTHGTPVITIDQQIEYLRNTIYSAEFDTSFTLTQTRHAGTVVGVIENLRISDPGGSYTILSGTLAFKRGTVDPFEVS